MLFVMKWKLNIWQTLTLECIMVKTLLSVSTETLLICCIFAYCPDFFNCRRPVWRMHILIYILHGFSWFDLTLLSSFFSKVWLRILDSGIYPLIICKCFLIPLIDFNFQVFQNQPPLLAKWWGHLHMYLCQKEK